MGWKINYLFFNSLPVYLFNCVLVVSSWWVYSKTCHDTPIFCFSFDVSIIFVDRSRPRMAFSLICAYQLWILGMCVSWGIPIDVRGGVRHYREDIKGAMLEWSDIKSSKRMMTSRVKGDEDETFNCR